MAVRPTTSTSPKVARGSERDLRKPSGRDADDVEGSGGLEKGPTNPQLEASESDGDVTADDVEVSH